MKDPDANAAGFLDGSLEPAALRWARGTRHRRLRVCWQTWLPVGSRVLEVGCGTGSASRIIADTRDAKIIGIEPNSRRAAAARARGLEVYQEVFTRTYGQDEPSVRNSTDQ